MSERCVEPLCRESLTATNIAGIRRVPSSCRLIPAHRKHETVGHMTSTGQVEDAAIPDANRLIAERTAIAAGARQHTAVMKHAIIAQPQLNELDAIT